MQADQLNWLELLDGAVAAINNSKSIHQLANEQLIKVKAAQDARANSNRPTDHFVKGDRVKVSEENRLFLDDAAGAGRAWGSLEQRGLH